MEKHPSNKPQWLIALEQESWQAELIISGLAIVGSLQLPGLISRFGQWALAYFPSEMGIFLYGIQIYLYFSACGLIIGFILHLILRAIWVGFIGINSVFPNGIKTDSKSYSPYFMERIKQDYDIKDSGIESLDKICSSMFATNTLGVMMTLAFIINILILYGIKVLLDFFLPTSIQLILGGIFLAAFFIISIYLFTINSHKYSGNSKLQERGYRLFTYWNIVMLHIFRRPINYLSNLISSNFERKRFTFWMFVSIIPTFLLSGYFLLSSGTVMLVDPERFLNDYGRTDITQIEEYESNLQQVDKPIYSALIESELIQGKMMKVFVPILHNEEVFYTYLCGNYETDEALDRDQNREKERLFYLDCYQKYHRISVNETEIKTQFIKHHHPHRNTFGVLTYLPTEDFIIGANQLKVEKLSTDSTGVFREMVIPFWFEGD